ncbi:hypothetical protein J23TS9_18030 [Paenibacillus sp. J23TS9]|nr:hypothetical protein J23TS9_18030 [Paenibacillus sp. J23TS9]
MIQSWVRSIFKDRVKGVPDLRPSMELKTQMKLRNTLLKV